jgi:hypothetical protein
LASFSATIIYFSSFFAMTYFIYGWKARAKLLGIVHGVVVQTRAKSFSNSVSELPIFLNLAGKST